jgi:hypothetical protein
MCIFCGGTCGGVGDSLITLAVASMPLIVTRVRSRLVKRKAVSRKQASTVVQSCRVPQGATDKNRYALTERST